MSSPVVNLASSKVLRPVERCTIMQYKHCQTPQSNKILHSDCIYGGIKLHSTWRVIITESGINWFVDI